jgi:hypothetical protein
MRRRPDLFERSYHRERKGLRVIIPFKGVRQLAKAETIKATQLRRTSPYDKSKIAPD